MTGISESLILDQLTEAEVQQFTEDPSTLREGIVSVCLYLRYSSDRQSEQSIEGQLRDCRAFCKSHSYRIQGIYVDRATSAKGDAKNRPAFQQMVSDARHHRWQYVVVWKLDRFARNRTDSAMYKYRLKQNGVRVLSVTEQITDSPEGIILESVLEGMAEFYSAELAQKINRGMRESALKARSVGGAVPLGYKLVDHKLQIDPLTAPAVKYIFEAYATGTPNAEIARTLNAQGYRTGRGKPFGRNSFHSLLRNIRYIGTYTFKDIRLEGEVPAIINKDLFDRVQHRLAHTAEAPARGKAKVDFLLSGRIFCGHCGAPMNGDTGTGKSGVKHHYYVCGTKKRYKTCEKKNLQKDYIEKLVCEDVMGLLRDDLIEQLADIAIEQAEAENAKNNRVPLLKAKAHDLEISIGNIVHAIEGGVVSAALTSRLSELEKEKAMVSEQLRVENEDQFHLEKTHVIYWLEQFKNGDIEDHSFRRKLIDLLVRRVTVWDEDDGYRIEIAYNLTSQENASYRATNRAQGFGYEKLTSTTQRISELAVVGTICYITVKHPRP